MKVVILAGGLGTRISEESHLKPKPMITIGDQPILWHIMKYYSSFGFHDFVICCGYKGHVIKEYFADYYLYRSDVTFDFSDENRMTVHQNVAEPWRVTLVDTGLNTQTGGRVKRVQKYIGNERFMLTYGDGVSDIDLNALLAQHEASGKLVTLTGIQPGGRFGVLDLDGSGETVTGFREKAKEDGGWINGGFMAAVKELAAVPSDVMPGAYASFLGPDPLNLLGVVILTSLGTWGLPQMIQKFYAIKDEKAVHTGTIISTLFAVVVSGGCYFLGGFSQISGVTPAADGSVAYDTIIPTMLSSLPDILIGIVVVLVLSASMSTLSSLVLTSSSTLTLDFIKPLFVKNMDEKKQLVWMRILLAFFIVLSVVIALDPPAFIAQLMGISWGALAGAFLAPFLYGLYWKGVTRAAVWASFICGVGITVSNMFIKYIASPINAGAVAMIAGLVVVPVVSLLTPKPDPEKVEGIFTCLDAKGGYLVEKSRAKGRPT